MKYRYSISHIFFLIYILHCSLLTINIFHKYNIGIIFNVVISNFSNYSSHLIYSRLASRFTRFNTTTEFF